MTRKLDDADETFMKSGNTSGMHNQLPVCFVGPYNLATEVNWVAGSLGSVEVLKVIQKDRSDCPEWTRWLRGHSPKEHRLMLEEQQERQTGGSEVVVGSDSHRSWLDSCYRRGSHAGGLGRQLRLRRLGQRR